MNRTGKTILTVSLHDMWTSYLSDMARRISSSRSCRCGDPRIAALIIGSKEDPGDLLEKLDCRVLEYEQADYAFVPLMQSKVCAYHCSVLLFFVSHCFPFFYCPQNIYNSARFHVYTYPFAPTSSQDKQLIHRIALVLIAPYLLF
jgi:hypothetical protein